MYGIVYLNLLNYFLEIYVNTYYMFYYVVPKLVCLKISVLYM